MGQFCQQREIVCVKSRANGLTFWRNSLPMGLNLPKNFEDQIDRHTGAYRTCVRWSTKMGKAMAKKKTPNKDGSNTSGNQTIDAKASEPKKKKTNPFEFIQQVRNEGAKVTWTTRNETLISTIMVLIMVAIMSIFFFAVDQLLRFGICNILPIECVPLS